MTEIRVSERERRGMIPVDPLFDEEIGGGWLTRSVFSDSIVCSYCGLNIPGAVAALTMERAREHRKGCPTSSEAA